MANANLKVTRGKTIFFVFFTCMQLFRTGGVFSSLIPNHCPSPESLEPEVEQASQAMMSSQGLDKQLQRSFLASTSTPELPNYPPEDNVVSASLSTDSLQEDRVQADDYVNTSGLRREHKSGHNDKTTSHQTSITRSNKEKKENDQEHQVTGWESNAAWNHRYAGSDPKTTALPRDIKFLHKRFPRLLPFFDFLEVLDKLSGNTQGMLNELLQLLVNKLRPDFDPIIPLENLGIHPTALEVQRTLDLMMRSGQNLLNWVVADQQVYDIYHNLIAVHGGSSDFLSYLESVKQALGKREGTELERAFSSLFGAEDFSLLGIDGYLSMGQPSTDWCKQIGYFKARNLPLIYQELREVEKHMPSELPNLLLRIFGERRGRLIKDFKRWKSQKPKVVFDSEFEGIEKELEPLLVFHRLENPIIFLENQHGDGMKGLQTRPHLIGAGDVEVKLVAKLASAMQDKWFSQSELEIFDQTLKSSFSETDLRIIHKTLFEYLGKDHHFHEDSKSPQLTRPLDVPQFQTRHPELPEPPSADSAKKGDLERQDLSISSQRSSKSAHTGEKLEETLAHTPLPSLAFGKLTSKKFHEILPLFEVSRIAQGPEADKLLGLLKKRLIERILPVARTQFGLALSQSLGETIDLVLNVVKSLDSLNSEWEAADHQVAYIQKQIDKFFKYNSQLKRNFFINLRRYNHRTRTKSEQVIDPFIGLYGPGDVMFPDKQSYIYEDEDSEPWCHVMGTHRAQMMPMLSAAAKDWVHIPPERAHQNLVRFFGSEKELDRASTALRQWKQGQDWSNLLLNDMFWDESPLEPLLNFYSSGKHSEAEAAKLEQALGVPSPTGELISSEEPELVKSLKEAINRKLLVQGEVGKIHDELKWLFSSEDYIAFLDTVSEGLNELHNLSH